MVSLFNSGGVSSVVTLTMSLLGIEPANHRWKEMLPQDEPVTKVANA